MLHLLIAIDGTKHHEIETLPAIPKVQDVLIRLTHVTLTSHKGVWIPRPASNTGELQPRAF